VTLLYCLALIPLSFSLDWFFQGKEAFAILSAARIANALVYVAVVVAFVHTPENIAWVPIGFALGNLVAALPLLYEYSRRYGSPRLIWAPDEWKGILAVSAPVGLATFLAQSAMNLPPIVIGWLVSNADAGTFSAALKVVVVILMIDRLLNALLLPAITRYFAQRRDDVAFFVAAAVKFLLILSVPLTLMGILFAPFMIVTIFGTEYAGAVRVLQILMGFFFFTLLNSIFVCSLIAAGKEKEYTFALNVGSAVLVVAIVIGTMLAGVRGAAAGVVVGELCTMVLMMRAAHDVIPLPLKSMLIRPAVAAAGMAACAFIVSQHHTVVQALLSLIVFGALVVVLKVVGAEEVHFLRERVV
jgi:O-antigen/teichoic acid export membrane protein